MTVLSSTEQSAVRFYFNLVSPLPYIHYGEALTTDYDAFTYGRVSALLSECFTLYTELFEPQLENVSSIDLDQDTSYTAPGGGVTEYGGEDTLTKKVPSYATRRTRFYNNVQFVAKTLGVSLF